jgi:molybdenum cofactor biosynthesis enzyme MoaA
VTGNDLSFSRIVSALRILRERGVKRVKITGGEPLLRDDIVDIMMACNDLMLDVTLCTNALCLTERHLRCLKAIGAKVKTSVHGPREIHNALSGNNTYDLVLEKIQMCISSHLFTSIHTMITRENLNVLIPMITFCQTRKIPKISFIPFVPRGRGAVTEKKYLLSEIQISQLKDQVLNLREKYYPEVDVRYIDLWGKEYFTLETDGSLIYSKERECKDIFIEQLV